MLFQIIEENGVKKIQALTADTGAGAPVGTVIAMYKKSSPSGYLYLDGSTFDQTKYPLLYAYLGSNKLPDYREFALVGAEENTTDVYNASTNPNGTIHDHDVFTEGQAKDDQLQSHTHDVPSNDAAGNKTAVMTQGGTSASTITIHTVNTNARNGTVTRGKRKAVYFYIKATSGLTENQQENVLNTINENLSYSTTEHKTGKKWIDGKDIYSIVLVQSGQITTNTAYFATEMANLNIDTITLKFAKAKVLSGGTVIRNNMTEYYADASDYFSVSVSEISAIPLFSGNVLSDLEITLEYTKTTDN